MLNLYQKLLIGSYIPAKYTNIRYFFVISKKTSVQNSGEKKGTECTIIFFYKNVGKALYFHNARLNLYQKLLVGGYIATKYTKFVDILAISQKNSFQNTVPINGTVCTMIFFFENVQKLL